MNLPEDKERSSLVFLHNGMKGGSTMKRKLSLALLISLVILSLLALGCSSASTVTQTVPGATVTLPAGTQTLPAVTVTLPSGVTTIAATTVTVAPITATLPSVPTTLAFLPTTPDSIPYDMGALTDCLTCHGVNSIVQYPLPPYYNGSISGSLNNVGIYIVVPGSIQDHTGRPNIQCLSCHDVY